MAYCTVADVEALMQIKFSHGSGRPLYADVEQMITDVAADLDGVVQAAGYTVPVTTAAAVALLRRYNTYGAAVAAWHAGYVSADEPPRVAYWRMQYEAFLARLRRGEQNLPGLTPESDLDPAWAVVPLMARDPYWGHGEDILSDN